MTKYQQARKDFDSQIGQLSDDLFGRHIEKSEIVKQAIDLGIDNIATIDFARPMSFDSECYKNQIEPSFYVWVYYNDNTQKPVHVLELANKVYAAKYNNIANTVFN